MYGYYDLVENSNSSLILTTSHNGCHIRISFQLIMEFEFLGNLLSLLTLITITK